MRGCAYATFSCQKPIFPVWSLYISNELHGIEFSRRGSFRGNNCFVKGAVYTCAVIVAVQSRSVVSMEGCVYSQAGQCLVARYGGCRKQGRLACTVFVEGCVYSRAAPWLPAADGKFIICVFFSLFL